MRSEAILKIYQFIHKHILNPQEVLLTCILFDIIPTNFYEKFTKIKIG